VDGERAPVAALARACAERGAVLVVDEAHALGVVGPGGAGLVAEAGLTGRDDVVRTATLSKALGSQGGVVLGSRALVDHLVDSARTFMFDTALAPASVGAALAAVRVLVAEPHLPGRAREVARRLHAAAVGAGWRPIEPQAAVVGIPVGSPGDAVRAAAAAAAAGVRVGCFRPPSVPDAVSRLRLTGRADVSADELGRAAAALAEAARAVRPEG